MSCIPQVHAGWVTSVHFPQATFASFYALIFMKIDEICMKVDYHNTKAL